MGERIEDVNGRGMMDYGYIPDQNVIVFYDL